MVTTTLGPRQVRRFWATVDVTPSCWLWTGRRDRYGYGAFSVTRASLLAHKVAYELVIGPVPRGLTLDHLCRVPACVNPGHLEPVTQAENMRRAGLAARQRNTTCGKGHEFTSENTYFYKGKRNCRACRRDSMRRLRSVSPT